MAVLLLAFGAIGHAILWVALVNRIHALGIARFWIDLLTVLCMAMLAVVPLAVAGALYSQMGSQPVVAAASLARVAWGYLGVCAALSVYTGFRRLYWRFHPERVGGLVANHTSPGRIVEQEGRLTAPGISTWMSRLPGNEVLTIRVQEKELAIPRLSREHEGVRIAHITDLHMSGRITQAYFEQVVEEVNRTTPDIVAITGDIIEREICLEWIPATLGRLRARCGVYYVLGNHDQHVNEAQFKAVMAVAGIIYLGGAWREVTVGDVPLILAGNEIPWYKPAADMSTCPPHNPAGLPLRILLAHSPDQFAWAQANDVDLILAGHLHGGQICFPLIGPITAPSVQGVRYASGVFRSGSTVMHVSRGTGSLTPIRYGCPPEIAVLTLKAAPRGSE